MDFMQPHLVNGPCECFPIIAAIAHRLCKSCYLFCTEVNCYSNNRNYNGLHISHASIMWRHIKTA